MNVRLCVCVCVFAHIQIHDFIAHIHVAHTIILHIKLENYISKNILYANIQQIKHKSGSSCKQNLIPERRYIDNKWPVQNFTRDIFLINM